MKKTLLAVFLLAALAGESQTLFTYGKTAVSKEEFLRAYNKNNSSTNSEKAYRDYLELYIRFKLKVQSGYDKGYDTLDKQKTELAGFRDQIAQGFMSDEASTQLLYDEAFLRTQKDIHVAHIYIPFTTPNSNDTIAAFRKASEAWSKLKSGESFANIATAYSADPSVKTNGGDIGFITAFSLPYKFETAVYETSPGNFSRPVKSGQGYHIFKVIETRPAVGRIKAAQILLAFQPDADQNQKNATKALADSIYTALKNGASFSELVAKYSNDNQTYQSGGLMPEFGVGKYEPTFENAVFALGKNGEISKPILSSFGYHIVQRLGTVPVNTDKNNADEFSTLKLTVLADNRIQVAKRALAKKTIATAGYKKLPYNHSLLMAYADSIWSGKKLPQRPELNDNTLIFSFPKQKVTAADFASYLSSVQNAPDLYRGKSMADLLEQYTEAVAVEYHKNNLEQFNKEFASQLNEFKEGNLLFEVMDQEVWQKASSDTVGLKAYYAAHPNKYFWESSADIILFTCTDSIVTKAAMNEFLKNKNNWKSLSMNSDGTIQADSGRYELSQIPVTNHLNLKPGYLSEPLRAAADNITSFVYVLKTYPEKTVRNLEDAKGFVINDYQSTIEDAFVQRLRKKYPIKVNEKVLASCWKN
ncbi:MAG: peptidylprolyl isomerase [Gemmatimonadaceae bacterium]|nr:peptidylprolyl isomerase [Chitinophagaceae bacterium]